LGFLDKEVHGRVEEIWMVFWVLSIT